LRSLDEEAEIRKRKRKREEEGEGKESGERMVHSDGIGLRGNEPGQRRTARWEWML
jgi:hypothetical protein